MEAVKRLGNALYQVLFPSDLSRLFNDMRYGAGGQAVRIGLTAADDPNVASWPWETLYDLAKDRFLALDTPFARLVLDSPFAPVVETRAPALRYLAAVDRPLKALATIGPGRDLQDNDLLSLNRAIKPKAELNLLPSFTLKGLESTLKIGFDVLHVIGVARYDEERGKGFVVAADPSGPGDELVSAGRFLAAVSAAPPRLVMLEVFDDDDSAKTALDMAPELLRARTGVEAVIVVQFRLDDAQARVLREYLYKFLTTEMDVEAAVARARLAIYQRLGYHDVWWAPVLFIRGSV
jgi:hypothetical protein